MMKCILGMKEVFKRKRVIPSPVIQDKLVAQAAPINEYEGIKRKQRAIQHTPESNAAPIEW